jgi:hypothetical protein
MWETKLNISRALNHEQEQATARLPIVPARDSARNSDERTHHSRQSDKNSIESSTMAAFNALPQSLVPLQFLQQQNHPKTIMNMKPPVIGNQLDGIDDDVSSSSDDDVENLVNNISSPEDEFDNENEDADKPDDDGLYEGKEDPDPLNSSDDVSELDPLELFDTDNVIICQYDKITRIKNRWKFYLKDGVMNINGKDYLFSKANGDAEW